MTDEKKQEFTRRITQANATGLTCIIYEMTMEYMEEAMALLDDTKAYSRAIDHADSCIHSLLTNLVVKDELSVNLFSLYQYIRRQLVRAKIAKDRTSIENGVRVLKGLLPAFEMLHQSDKNRPLMEHAQVLYEGLTYGASGNLMESMHEGTNRGMLA